jgi:hypothetical protein
MKIGAIVLLAVVVFPFATQAQPSVVTYSGRLTDGQGWGQSAQLDLVFGLHGQAEGGSALWTSPSMKVNVEDGYFSVVLADVAGVFAANAATWLSVSVGGGETASRQAVNSVPYCLEAQHLGGRGADGYVWNQTGVAQAGGLNVAGHGLFGGNVGIGTANPAEKLHMVNGDFRMDQDGREATLDFYGAGAAGQYGARLNVFRARNSVAAPATVGTGDAGFVQYNYFWDGSKYLNTGGLYYAVDNGAVAADRVPSVFLVATHPDSTAPSREVFRVNSAGNVGIGSTTPEVKLHVNGGDILLGSNSRYLQGTTTTGARIPMIGMDSSNYLQIGSGEGNNEGIRFQTGVGDAMWIGKDGRVLVTKKLSINGNCAQTSGACDLAETFLALDHAQPGDVVSLDPARFKGLRLSAIPYDPAVAGVVSTDPTLVMGQNDVPEGIPIALAGVVPVKVTLENGPIAVGDALTSSSTPGHAMRATAAGPVVGKAMEPFDASQGWAGTLRILVAPAACSSGPSDEIDRLRATIEFQGREIAALKAAVMSLQAAAKGNGR